MARAIMIQGTGSNVGKSLVVAGLARVFANRGLRVRPFKPQNMSNNAAVTPEGGEIGRAQALQALAARVAPHTDMNPVLLKPESDTGAQVIVQGKPAGALRAFAYGEAKPNLLPAVLESFHRLASACDLVVVEGAGSPAEINLRKGDIANMGFACAAGVPVILIGDIDRGGVIAQLAGTKAVLDAADAAQIRGFAVNRFRGDLRLFDDGVTAIEAHTGWPSLGVIPWFQDAWRLPAEDVMDVTSRGSGRVKIAVPRLGRIANFDDLDPLAAEPDVTVQIIEPGRPLPGDADLVLIPGSKATIADLEQFRALGWDIDLAAHIRRGGHVLGLCGGYQMLGKDITDPFGIEGAQTHIKGLGLLDIRTTMQPDKRVTLTRALHLETGTEIAGYEIHLGQTDGADCARGWLRVGDRLEGAASANGQIMGCYLHGIFASDTFRNAFLSRFGASAKQAYSIEVDQVLDALAAHLEAHMDLDQLLSICGEVRLQSSS